MGTLRSCRAGKLVLGELSDGVASMSRVFNFNAGPAPLPPSVLQEAQSELLNYRGQGMSILEMSHRVPEYEEINARAEANFKRLIGVGEGYRVVFMQGGASGQFATVPMNFLKPGQAAEYLVTGTWGEKAVEEAELLGMVHVAASTVEGGYRRVPRLDEIKRTDRPSAYVHLTSNETIQGVQYPEFPDLGAIPLVGDMSSDILSRTIDVSKFSLIYAGAQKNLGPAGVTVVLIRESWLEQANRKIPTMLRYATHVKHHSLYNTPPTFSVYLLDLFLNWIDAEGGMSEISQRNDRKAAIVYDAIDRSGGFYRGHAEVGSRSKMNATFNLPTPDLEKRFIAEAKAEGMVGLAGHRSVGGARASLYNAIGVDACQVLADFMAHFASKNG